MTKIRLNPSQPSLPPGGLNKPDRSRQTPGPGDSFQPLKPGDQMPPDPRNVKGGEAFFRLLGGLSGGAVAGQVAGLGGALLATAATGGTDLVLQMLSNPSTISASNLPAGPLVVIASVTAAMVGLKGGFSVGGKLGAQLGKAVNVAAGAIMGIPGYLLKLCGGGKPVQPPPLPNDPPPSPAPPKPSAAAKLGAAYGLVSSSLGGVAVGLSLATRAESVSAFLTGAAVGPLTTSALAAVGIGAVLVGTMGTIGGWELGRKLGPKT